MTAKLLERRPVVEYREGPEGERGPRGPQGERGPQGFPGRDGTNGRDGANGINGRDGIDAPTFAVDWDVSIKRFTSNKRIEYAVMQSERGDVVVITPAYQDNLLVSAKIQRETA